jgi:hypothetical protein
LPADVLLDEKGQAHFQLPSPLTHDVWANIKAVAHYPVIVQVVRREELLAEKAIVTEPILTSGKCTLSIAYEKHMHTLLISSSQPEFVTATVTSPTGKAYLIPLIEGKGVLELSAVPEEFVVRFYAKPSPQFTMR